MYSLSKFDFLKLSSLYKSYLKSCIAYINPKIILTYIHNNEVLWDLCKDINANFYIFQNGYCSPTDPLPKRFKTSKNTIFFTLTKERSSIIKRNGVNSIPFGSIQSNSIAKSDSISNKRIIFVSQFRDMKIKKR